MVWSISVWSYFRKLSKSSSASSVYLISNFIPVQGSRPSREPNPGCVKLPPQAVLVEFEMPSPEIENPQCSPLAALPLCALASLRPCTDSPECWRGLYKNPKPCFHEPTCNLE